MPADDNFYVVDNPHTHEGLSWSTVKWAFTAMNMVNWIPLTWLAHAADYQMFGADPAGHHLVNLFLHALAAWLLFWTLKRATGFLGRSFMVAAVFALHPINVEPVAWVAELKTMLSMIFLLLTLDLLSPLRRRAGHRPLLPGGAALRARSDGQVADHHAALRSSLVGLLAPAADVSRRRGDG